MKKWYLLVIWNEVSIVPFGPYRSFDSVKRKATAIRREHGDKHGLHWICIDGSWKLKAGDFSGLELENRSPAEEPVKP